MTDYYRVLQLENRERSSRDDIVRAFRRLAKRSHPDKGGDPDHFNLLVTAFKVLIDPDSKREHDSITAVQKSHHELKNNRDDLTLPPVHNRRLDNLFDEANVKLGDTTDAEYIKREKRKLRKLKREIHVKRIIPEYSPNVFNRCFEYAKANSGIVTNKRPGTVTECNRVGSENVMFSALDHGFIASDISSDTLAEFARKKDLTERHKVITSADRSTVKSRLSEYTNFVIPDSR